MIRTKKMEDLIERRNHSAHQYILGFVIAFILLLVTVASCAESNKGIFINQDPIDPQSIVPFMNILPDASFDELLARTGGTATGNEYIDFDVLWRGLPCHALIQYKNDKVSYILVENIKETAEDDPGLKWYWAVKKNSPVTEYRNDIRSCYGDTVRWGDRLAEALVFENSMVSGMLYGETANDLQLNIEINPFKIDLFESHDSIFYKTSIDDMEDQAFVDLDFDQAKNSAGEYYEMTYAPKQTNANQYYFTSIYPSILIKDYHLKGERIYFRIFINYVGSKFLNVDSCIIKLNDHKYEFENLEAETTVLEHGAVMEKICIVLQGDDFELLNNWISETGEVKIRVKGANGSDDLSVPGGIRMGVSDMYKLFVKAQAEEMSDSKALETAKEMYEEKKYSDAMDILKDHRQNEEANLLYGLCFFHDCVPVSDISPIGTFWVKRRHYNDDELLTMMNISGLILAENVPEDQMIFYLDDGTKLSFDAAVEASTNLRNKQTFHTAFFGNLAIFTRNKIQYAVDKDGGETKLDSHFDYQRVASDNLLCYLDQTTQKYGCTDLSGNIVIKPQSDIPIFFYHGYSMIGKGDTKNRQYALMNESGEIIIQYGKYSSFNRTMLSEDLIVAYKEKKQGQDIYIIDANGKIKKKPNEVKGGAIYGNTVLLIQEDGRIITDRELNQIVPIIFNEVSMIVCDQVIIGKTSGSDRINLFNFDGKNLTNDKYYYLEANVDSPYVFAGEGNGTNWHILDLYGNMIF